MRNYAKWMERFIAEGPEEGDCLHPTRVQSINELATMLKWQLRTNRLPTLCHFGWELLPSYLQRGAQTN